MGLISFVGGILWTAKQGAKAVFHKQCDLVVRMAVIGGVSALLSMLNSCASGVSVVNIDNGFGAGYLASMMNHMRG